MSDNRIILILSYYIKSQYIFSIGFQAIMAALPGLAALFGVVALAYAQANDHNNQRNSINDALNRIGQTEQEQTSICNSVLL